MMEKYIFCYIIYDPLNEKVICVHDEENIECELCKPYRSRTTYQLEESQHMLRIK